IIENPILANFREGLSVLEYFIFTHGARKGLADTALKTADAGYLTRRLVDVAQDVVINEVDCGTLRGLSISALKKNEEVVESLYDRILGRVALHDIYHPETGALIVAAGEEINEELGKKIEESPIETVEIRSVLTCEAKQGVCAKCYGRNLANSRLVQRGEAVGVIAAQSIGEPGTQLTLRTFHVGGVAGGIATQSKIEAKYDGLLEIDELRSVPYLKDSGDECHIVIGRSAEMRLVHPKTKIVLASAHIPYGAHLYCQADTEITKGTLIADWDPFNAVILSDVAGKVSYFNFIENQTFRIEREEQTGYHDKVIIESRHKAKNPAIVMLDEKGEEIKAFDMPVGARVTVEDGQVIKAGDILVKIPRAIGKTGDITGGLPRVTELFEARNPIEPAKVAEIDGVVSFGKKLKRGNREVIITSKTGETKSYLIPTSKQILAQENDYVKAGTPLSEGSMTPSDILAIKGPMKVQEYIVNEIQEVYRLQGVKINDKHFEVIVRQMMRKIEVEDPGDTNFLEGELVDRQTFIDENDQIFGQVVVTEAGDSENVKEGQIISFRKLRDENSLLKRRDKRLIEVREAKPATGKQELQGITRASLQTKSWLSSASFQETTKVLTNAAISAQTDYMIGLKENVIVGGKIPAGTGMRDYQHLIVAGIDEVTPEMLQGIEVAEQKVVTE
ncbi:MAG: DNA-directed RNA polymerase subunit beta', partial [Bacteroidales bacterium]|nr:DNA-directed RNA polymerase subunit beta' [Bacteroidales bacterium]